MKKLTQNISPAAIAVYTLGTIAGGAIILFVINAVVSGISSTLAL